MTGLGGLSRQEVTLLLVITLFLVTGKWLILIICLAVLLWINPALSVSTIPGVSNPRVIAAYSSGRDNNFNLIRMLAAWAVLFSHTYPLSGTRPDNWFSSMHPGTYAVYIFFAISGFLVAKSFARKADLRAFARARVLRIVPALLVVSALSALLLGGIMTTLDAHQYFSDPDVWKYIVNNALMIHTEYKLPGVFADNPYPEAVNGSLWSLRFEMRMYIALALLGMLGAVTSQHRFILSAAFFLVWYLCIQFMPQWFDSLRKTQLLAVVALYFYIGVFYFRFAHRVELSSRVSILLLLVAAAGWLTPLRELTLAIALSYFVFYFALVPGGLLRAYNRIGDYSYGFYLYAFPVQQLLVANIPGMGFYSMLLWASVITLGFAMLSWYLVEKPALRLVGSVRLLPLRKTNQ